MRQLERYVLYDEIASGGMATVHFGRLRGGAGFSKTVAIKTLHPEYARDRDFVAMFLDEVRIAARIQHPNVVPTLDVVSSETEIFLVMEYVDGEVLSRMLKAERSLGERTPPRVAASIVTGVLRGLQAAHEAVGEDGEPLGIIHRDVSPHNIMVGRDGIPRLLDFGVAKVAGQLQSTREGQVKGKLLYMAPEQVAGHRLDARADLYAAAVVLWEALTGERLRDAGDEGAVYAQVLSGAVKTPSQVVDGLSDAVDAVVLKALARDRERRYETAGGFADALEEVLGVVSPREVGRWVAARAGDVLEARAAVRKEIEADSSSDVRSVPNRAELLATYSDEDRTPSKVLRSGAHVAEGSATLPTLSALPAGAAPSPRRRVGARWGLVLVGAVVMAGIIYAYSSRSGNEGLVPADAGSGQPAELGGSEVTDAPMPAVPSATDVTGATATGTRSTVPTGEPSEGPAQPTATARPPSSQPAHRRPPRAKPSVDCDPPYFITPQGTRRYKVECL